MGLSMCQEFDQFCSEKGIKRHKTVPANQQQNGVAERMNRTLMERVRCLLSSSGVSKSFWGEAVSTTAYLINKCPTSGIQGEIPDERWHGGKCDYSRLRPFGCKAFAHQKQGKLNLRAVQCIMLGYQKGVKGYRLWSIEPGHQKVIVIRDAVFIEDMMPLLKPKTDNESENARISGNDDFEVELEQVMAPEHTEPGIEFSDGVEGSLEAQDETSDQPQQDQSDLGNYQLARDRQRRMNVKAPARFSDSEMLFFALHIAEQLELNEPASYAEAIKSPESKQWVQAMKEELDSLISNKTWILVDKVELRKVIGCKWVFKKKFETANAQKVRFKERLVAKGYNQEEGIDFNEVFSPVVKHNSIRVLLSMAAKRDWELEQLDVKTAFLNGDLKETIYMSQPQGFEVPGTEGKVCLLRKSLYGLKQSSRQWYLKFGECLSSLGFVRSLFDSCVFVKRQQGKQPVYLLLYVDDMFISGADVHEINKVKA